MNLRKNNMDKQIQEKSGSVAFTNLYKTNPNNPIEYAMLSITEYGENDTDARKKLLAGIEAYKQEGWTEFRPSGSAVKEQSGEVLGEDEVTRIPIDDSGDEIKIFTVKGIEKYISQSNKEWMRVHVEEESECKYGLTGNPDWKLPDNVKKWFNEKAVLNKIYKSPDEMKYVVADKNQKGYWSFVKEFRSTK
jgi:hypothetical protein